LYSDWIRKHRRTLGIPLVVAAIVLAHYRPELLMPSLVLVIAGEALRIWSAGHLCKEQLLTTGGPYRFIRNPLYLGSFLITIGFCLIAGSLWVWILALCYFLFCYVPVIRWEEKILREKFRDYADYARAVPAFYPTVRLYRPATTRFSVRQAIRNKEYNAVLGICAGYLLLAFLR
jgi:protein-S-isoprenylcysteine O-methyltransferase Ste14